MPLCADAQGLDSFIEKLESTAGYQARVTYAVTLPQAEDDVVYTIDLVQPASDSYLIDWSTTTPSGPLAGFSAYAPGHFYTYRNNRLREYHIEWDSLPMLGERAVQHTAQFASLVPGEVAHEFRQIIADPEHYVVTIKGNEVKVSRMASDQIDAEMKWTFSPETGMPLEFTGEYNPGSISEQTVKARYETMPEPMEIDTITEEWLRERYPEVFENYRQSNFAIESMPGQKLPSFSLPLTFGGAGERLTRQSTDGFTTAAAVVVLLEGESTLAEQLVREVRKAAALSPIETEVIYAFTGRDPEVNGAALLNRLLPGETAVNGARRLASDCGAAALPVVMVCDGNATVKYVTVGLNNEMAADVMKMITLSTSSTSM